MLLGLVVNVIAVVLLSRPLGMLVRRLRPDMPGVVARNYAGTVVVVAVTAVIAVVGLAHRPQIQARQRAIDDAIARAQAWIGDRAPDQFRRNLQYVSLLAIEPGTIYRACVPSVDGTRSYCVIVNRDLPFQNSVSFSGYEPNSVLGRRGGVASGDQAHSPPREHPRLGDRVPRPDDRRRRAAVDPLEPAREPGRSAMGRRGVPADAVLAAPARRVARRRARAKAGVHRRPDRVRRVLARLRGRADQRRADRRPGPAGSCRRAARAELAGADPRRVRGRRAGGRDRHMDRVDGRRHGDRAARRRRARDRDVVALDLPDQPDLRGGRGDAPATATPGSPDRRVVSTGSAACCACSDSAARCSA